MFICQSKAQCINNASSLIVAGCDGSALDAELCLDCLAGNVQGLNNLLRVTVN